MIGRLRQRIIDALPKNSFVRGVIALSGGTIGAQAIAIAASPILTRLYTPEMFGVVSVFVGISAIFGVLATWCYEIAIPQADDDAAAANLVFLCAALSLVMFIISSVVVFLFKNEIASAFHLKEIAAFLWLIPLFILISGFYRLLTFWNYRKRKFGNAAAAAVHKNAWAVLPQIGLYSFGELAFLGGQLFGQAMAVIMLMIRSPGLFREKFEWSAMRRVATRFRKYPIFSTWSGVFGAAAQQVPMLMFAALFSPVVAGFYSLSYRVINMPMILVGTAITNVFLPHAADEHRKGQLGVMLADIHAVLVRLSTPVVIVLAVIAPTVFALIFGREWREAGHYVQLLAIMLYVSFMYSPVSTSFGIMDRQDAGLMLHIGLLLVSIASIWFGATKFHSVWVSIVLYSVSRSILYVWALCWIHHAAGSSRTKLLWPVFSALLRSLPIAIPLAIAVWLHGSVWITVVLIMIAVSAAALYYLPLLRQLRRPDATEASGS